MWRALAPFILGDVRTVIDIPQKKILFYIDPNSASFKGLSADLKGVYDTYKIREEGGFYVYELKRGIQGVFAHEHRWQIEPIRVSIKPCPAISSEQAKLANLPPGFNANDDVIQIDFNYSDSRVVPGKINVAPPILIATQGIRLLTLDNGAPFDIGGIKPKDVLVDLIKETLLPPLPAAAPPRGVPAPAPLPRGTAPRRQGGGAIQRIDTNLDDIPYIMALQRLWEERQKHYKDLEPEYQQLLPEPDESPVQNFKEPFHEYIESFGDQELLEEARSTIGLMPPEQSEEIFLDDYHHVNSLYEKALPEINKDWIPIFVRADMLRLLLDK